MKPLALEWLAKQRYKALEDLIRARARRCTKEEADNLQAKVMVLEWLQEMALKAE